MFRGGAVSRMQAAVSSHSEFQVIVRFVAVVWGQCWGDAIRLGEGPRSRIVSLPDEDGRSAAAGAVLASTLFRGGF